MKTTKKQPLVSVIMNCYNGEKYLAEAIKSVLNQTYINFEIIFWDNVSTDNSANIVRSYNDDRIKYFLAKKHTPLGKARNCALEKVKGDYIAFLDIDDVWLPEKLEKQLPYFRKTDVGLVYSKTSNINSVGEIILRIDSSKRVDYKKIKFNELFFNYDIVLSSTIISRNALKSIGGKFDKLLKYAEEYDLFMNIIHDYRAIRVEKMLTLYRVHEEQDSVKLFECSIFEMKYIVSKLILIYPITFAENPKLMQIKDRELAWLSFLNNILKNKTRIARMKLRPHIFESVKFFIFYFLSILSPKLIIKVWNKYRIKIGQLPIIK